MMKQISSDDGSFRFRGVRWDSRVEDWCWENLEVGDWRVELTDAELAHGVTIFCFYHVWTINNHADALLFKLRWC